MAKTWHQRVSDLLALSLRLEPNDSEEFIAAIPKLKVETIPESFVYERCDEKGVYRPTCSETAVRQTVDLCVEIGLIKKASGELTDAGRIATDAMSFDRVVERQLWNFAFKPAGLSPDKLRSMVRTILRRDPLELPTAEQIWSELGEPGDLMVFKRLLRLLASCGGAVVSQKPLYLPSPRRK